jgi:aldehyde dehydrogenase (NAD+)
MQKHFINGQWIGNTNSAKQKICPCTGEVMDAYCVGTPEEVQLAVDAASKAQKNWRAMGRVKRAEILANTLSILKRDIAVFQKAISLETGKSLNESLAEVYESIHMMEYTVARGRSDAGRWLPSEIPDRDIAIIRKPKGVVAVISPWNFPMAIGGFWCAAPALLEGNAVVWKPSEHTPMIAWLVCKMYAEAGLPDGVLNLVQGDGTTGAALVKSDVNHICFTGSKDIGQYIRRICAEGWGKTCSLETGSKSAVIVFGDADIDFAVNACIPSAFKTTGQRCVSAGRILIERKLYKSFSEAFTEAAKKITWGSPFSTPAPFYGPIITEAQLYRVLRYNEMVDPKHVLLRGEFKGEPNENNLYGNYVSPHVYAMSWGDAPYLHEEVFGPHVAVVPFDETEEAIEIFNDTPYGLSLGIITNDARKARLCREQCDYGMAYWNNGCIGAESHVPFGGVKASGYGGASASGTFDTTSHQVAWSSNFGEVSFPQGLK